MQTVTNIKTGAIVYSGPENYFSFNPYLICKDYMDSNCTPDLYTINSGILEIPKVVSMRQARLALLAIDKLEAATAAVTAAGSAPLVEWDYATTVERSSVLTVAIAAAIGLSETDMDDLFINAATL